MSYMPHGSDPQHSQFTCNTCGIKFIAAELQRKHMKTDWHRYNLKRRVVGLPSISSDVFAEKVLQSKEDEEVDELGFPLNKRERRRSFKESKQELKSKLVDKPIRRLLEHSVTTQLSEFSLGDADLVSYHSEIETGSELNYGESETYSEVNITSDDESFEEIKYNQPIDEDLTITDCFFCNQKNNQIESNIKHMFNKHGLYIPERSFLDDVEGLLEYLMEKIVNYECLVCSFIGKNLLSIRQHMQSKGHCKIPYETKDDKLQLCQFYTFYQEEEEDDEVKKSQSETKVKFAIEENQSEDELSSSDSDNGINDNYSIVKLDETGREMTLPTGSIICHRTNRNNNKHLPVARDLKDGTKTVALVDRRFSPGLTAHTITKQEKEVQRIEQKVQNESVRRDKSKKINYQPHFRDFILGT